MSGPPPPLPMPTQHAAAPPRAVGVRWTVLALLFAATTLCYLDRTVLAVLGPTLTEALHWSEGDYSHVVMAFQLAYAIGLAAAGRFLDVIGVRLGYALAVGAWSLAAMAHALVGSVSGFMTARFLLGLAEAGNFPAAIKSVAQWFPIRERALATGIFNSGANMGAILAPVLVPWVALHFGWRAAFLTTGLFSAAWIVWWWVKYRKPHERMDWSRGAIVLPPPGPVLAWWKLLGYRQTWGFMVGKFLTDPVWWFFLFWLPGYFSSRFSLDLSHLGLPLIVVYNLSVVGSVGGGWLPKGFIRLGMGLKPARLAAMLTCACLVVPMVFAGGLHSEWGAVALLGLAASAHQGWSANIFTTPSDMFPAEYVGTVVSFGQVAGAAGGAIFAALTGHIIEITHSYAPLFLYAAFAYLAALLLLRALAPGLKRALPEV